MAKSNRSDVAFVSFRFILFIALMIFIENSMATNTLARSQELPVEQTLISSDRTFELGFFRPGNSSKRFIGIWYKNIALTKAVWVMNRENPLDVSDTGPVLTIASDGNLKLLDGTRKTVWSTNVSSNPDNTIAVLSEKGELSLQDNTTGTTLWASFDLPSDSLIAGMRIGLNNQTGEKYVLNSWRADDPSPGEFVLGFTTDSPPQNIMWKNSRPHWRSGPWDGWRFIGLYQTNTGYSNGFMVQQDNAKGSVFASYNPPSTSQVMVEVLTSEGNLEITRWDIGTQEGGVKWKAIEVFCDVYGSCGPFGVCNRPKATCECLRGFSPNSEQEWSKGNWTRGCRRRIELDCAKNSSTKLSNTDSDGFARLKNMKAPDHYSYLFNVNDSDCKQRCSSNCMCVAYAYVDGIGCLTWAGELLDVQKFGETGTDIYLRLAQSELDKGKKNIQLMASLITVFGTIVLSAFMYGLYKCIGNRQALRRRRILQIDLSDKMAPLNGSPLRDMWGPHASQPDSSDLLPMIEFSTLAAATNNFHESNKLGAGGFGPVYKGKLEDGQEIAVKRLSSHSGQGAVEFKNEILLISKLQHRNLVRLLGYCIKGDEKLLIYEYLKNKSLDTFLFDTRMGLQIDWAKRFRIIEGIARGLLYLHRDSCLRVIHRDLKPSNILLDDNMNPKISDFGLARAFQITQELANTHRVVGTFGYMSPEYAMGGLLSEKSDVFSFGVMILEIISGERNTSFFYEEKYLNLLGYAWCLWNEDKGLEFMNKELPDSCSSEDFMKFMKIGLLCVQDHAIDRPTMSSVVLMLTGDTNIPQPKQPTFYQGLLYSDLRTQFKKLSMNAVSLTNIVGR